MRSTAFSYALAIGLPAAALFANLALEAAFRPY